jgi:hypothetical protein
MRGRIAALVDFETVEPREFWRVAMREALAESKFDPNPLIDALFDADRIVGASDISSASSISALVAKHLDALEGMIEATRNPAILAAAAIALAVSLGYSPAAVTS